MAGYQIPAHIPILDDMTFPIIILMILIAWLCYRLGKHDGIYEEYNRYSRGNPTKPPRHKIERTRPVKKKDEQKESSTDDTA